MAVESVDVAVVLILREGMLLLDYNPAWRAFNLPMTKLHDLPGPVPGAAAVPEEPWEAAVRAAAEVLGRPLGPDRVPVLVTADLPPWNQSARTGEWKRYRVHLYALDCGAEPRPLPGHAAVWLTPDEVLTHQPVSPTARAVVGQVNFGSLPPRPRA